MKKGATWSSTFGHFGHPRDPHHQTSLPLTATSWHSFSVLMLWGRCPWVSISSEALHGAVGRCRFRGQRFSMEVRNSCVPLQKDSSRSFVRLSLTSAGAGKGGKRVRGRGRYNRADWGVGLGGWEWVPIKGLQPCQGPKRGALRLLQVPLRAITGLRLLTSIPQCKTTSQPFTYHKSQPLKASPHHLLPFPYAPVIWKTDSF